MLKSFRGLFICCVGFSVTQASSEDNIDESSGSTELPDNSSSTPTDCGLNEVFECTYPCPPLQTCRNREESISCLDELQFCEHKCVCQSGFYRNTEDGVCVSEKQCAKCSGPNEHYACGYPCDNVCNTLHLENKTNCPNTYDNCHPSCYCDDGHARDDRGVCIPINECPRPKCSQNEVLTHCKRAFCSNETCSSIVSPQICDSEEPCNLGCVCKDGFFRIEENAPCIQRCECPELNDSHECSTTRASRKKSSYYLFKLLVMVPIVIGTQISDGTYPTRFTPICILLLAIAIMTGSIIT